MEVKIPKVNESDIIRIIRRDFPSDNVDIIREILNGYVSENENGKRRVHASILKLSNGDIRLLTKNVEKAKEDFRNIISLSENPNYWENAFDDSITEKKKSHLIAEDWYQYQEWFNRCDKSC